MSIEAKLRPFSIRIFVPNGDPDGLRLVEKSNWTGIGVVFNRSNIKEALGRPEIDRTGVYVLVGRPEDSALPIVYVGEGDPVRERLKSHNSNKDFWDWCVFFVTKDNSLNKAHVQRMECRLLDLAREAKQCRLDNRNCPTPPTLSEADEADVDSFLLDMLSVLPLVGLMAFEKPQSRSVAQELLHIEAKGIRATGYEGSSGFVVCAGSGVVGEETPAIQPYVSALRRDLISEGVIVSQNESLLFSQDHIFGSPSTAAGVILGQSVSGRKRWRSQDGTTLKELQTREAGDASPE